MKKSVICLLLMLTVGLWETEMYAQRMTICCSNTTGSDLDVTVILKSPEGKSVPFSCDKLKNKSFNCDLNETGEYSLTVMFKKSGGRKPVIPFGTCKFTVTGDESSIKADASCALADMLVLCESLNMSAQVSSDSTGEFKEYSNRRHGSLLVRKFYPQSVAANLNVADNTSEKTSAWDISVISITE